MRAAAALLLAAGCATAPAPQAPRDTGPWYRQDRVTGSVNMHFGGRFMAGDAFARVDEQFMTVIDADVTPRRWPIGFETSFGSSFDDDGYSHHGPWYLDQAAYVADFSLGLRKTLYLRGFRPYVGAGATWVWADVDQIVGSTFVHDEEASWGWYAHGGSSYRFPGGFNLGADARWTFGTDADFRNASGDLDSWQFSVFFGFAW